MKTKILLLLVLAALCGCLTSVQAATVSVTIQNVGTNTITIAAGGWNLSGGAGCAYSLGYPSGSIPVTPGNSGTMVVSMGYWGGGCSSSAVVISTPCGSFTIGNENTTSFSISYSQNTCTVVTNYIYVPPITSTNVTQCIQNTSSHFVTATATVGGVLIGSKTLYPGETWCVTARIQLDGSSGDFVMGYTLSPVDTRSDPNNPFATNGMNSDFSVTNGFTSTNFTPINPFSGNTNYTEGGGGVYTNTLYVGSTNFSDVLWTNNINYPNTGTAGDARDSTLKAGFGALHNDNAVSVAALKLIWTDMEGMKTLAAVTTNLLGQVVAAIWHQTNNDQLPVFINSMTNNATANEQALKTQMQSDTAAITNALAAGAAGSSQLTNLNNTMGGVSNFLSQITSMTNADIATETTQSGMSNLLSQINSNTAAGRLTLTNYALQTTLAGMSNLLGQADVNSEGLSNAIGALDTVLGDTNALVDDTNAGYTVTMLSSTNPLTIAAQAANDSLNADYTYRTTESSFAAFIASVVGPSVDDVVDITPMIYTFNLGPAGTTTFDFNPLDHADIAPLFAFAKALFTWGLAVYYMLLCAKDSVQACELLMAGRGVTGPVPVQKTVSK